MEKDIKAGYKQALQILKDAKDKCTEALSEPHEGSVLLGITSSLDKSIGKVAFHAGEDAHTGVVVDNFPPITNILGEKVEAVQLVKEEAAKLTPDEQREYKKKIRKLYKEWDTIDPRHLLDSHLGTPDEIDLRAVAKMAEYPGAAVEDLNIKFVENVTKAMKAKVKKAKEDLETEEMINQDQQEMNK